MCSPAKLLSLDVDVLDLSRKSSTPIGLKDIDTSDIIILSENEEDRIRPGTSDTEKENTPLIKQANDKMLLLRRLENDLRLEENTLLLLNRLKENQNSNSSSNGRSTSKSTPLAATISSTTSGISQVVLSSDDVTVNKIAVSNSTKLLNAPAQVISSGSFCNNTTPKISKSIALQSLEQQYATKKSTLRKQLDRNLEKIILPKPTSGTGLCEVAFMPSALTAEFTALLGVEEVVKSIQDFDLTCGVKSTDAAKRVFNPFSCVRCQTDFTPVWKRERPGSSDVICEACLAGSQRSNLQAEYELVVRQTLQQHLNSEQEVEREFNDIANTPSKLEAYIHEQEKKLIAAQQTATQINSQRYHNKQFSSGTSGNIGRIQHSSVSSISASNNNTHQRQNRQAVSTTISNSVNNAVTPHLSAFQQQLATVSQQLASQYQQQISKAGTAGSNQNANAAALMMAASLSPALLAATTGSQQQQQQQRLAAAITAIQQQQTQTPQQQATLEQVAQLQAALFMNNLLYGTASNQAGNMNPQQLLQHALQYSYLLQQQQQHAIAAQQVQQQTAATAQLQQATILSQIMGSRGVNSSACLSLLQNLWAFNSAATSSATANSALNSAKK